MIKHVCQPWGQRWRFLFKEGVLTKRLRWLSCERISSHGVKRAFVPACCCSSQHQDAKSNLPISVTGCICWSLIVTKRFGKSERESLMKDCYGGGRAATWTSTEMRTDGVSMKDNLVCLLLVKTADCDWLESNYRNSRCTCQCRQCPRINAQHKHRQDKIGKVISKLSWTRVLVNTVIRLKAFSLDRIDCLLSPHVWLSNT